MKWRTLLVPVMTILACYRAEAGMLPDGPFTEKARGTAAASFLKINSSVRSASLADSISLESMDPASGFQTPAAFNSHGNQPFLTTTSSLLPEEAIQASAFYGHPLGNRKIVFGTHQLLQPAIALYDTLGNKTAEFSPWDGSFLVGYSGISRTIPWGMSMTYLETRIGPGISGSGAELNLGFGLPLGFFSDPNLAFSFALSHIGPPLRLSHQSVPLPLRGQSSIAYRVTPITLAAVDILLPVDQAPYVAASVEWKISFNHSPQKKQMFKTPMTTPADIANYADTPFLDSFKDPQWGLALWAGVNTKNKSGSIGDRLSYGLRLYLSKFSLDAGAASFGHLGFFPRFNLSFQF